MAIVVAKKIIEMFFIMLCGIVLFKAGLIDDKTVPRLSNILLMLVSPLMIFQSYQMDFDGHLMWGLGLTLIAALTTFTVIIILTNILIRNTEYSRNGISISSAYNLQKNKIPVEKIALIYSNSGFIGLPLINGVIGQEGVFYMTAYLTVFNLLLWTHGVIVMGGAGDFKTICRNLCTPTIIAIFAGVICFVTGIKIPAVIDNPIQYIANMNTPLAMLIAGANLAQSNIVSSLKSLRMYYLCALKLIIFPVIGMLILYIFNFQSFDFNVPFTVFIGMACPAGASAIMFAERYNKDSLYATEIFVLTTILSLITIPLLSIFAIKLFGL